MPILLLFAFPGFIIFDFIPELLGFKSLSDWYCDKYKTTADDLLGLYVIVGILLFGWLCISTIDKIPVA